MLGWGIGQNVINIKLILRYLPIPPSQQQRPCAAWSFSIQADWLISATWFLEETSRCQNKPKTVSFCWSSSCVWWQLHQSSGPGLKVSFEIFSLPIEGMSIETRFAHKETWLPSAGMNAVQVKHDLRTIVVCWHFAISYGCSMFISPDGRDLPDGQYNFECSSCRNCLRCFLDWQVCANFLATGCAKNNF